MESTVPPSLKQEVTNNSTVRLEEVMRKEKSESTTALVMGGRNSVNPEQSRAPSTVSSVVGENDTEMEMDSQIGSVGFSGSNISVQGETPYVRVKLIFLGRKGEIFRRIREFEKLKDVNTFVTFLSAIRQETLCVYDIYEYTRREKLYEGRKPNRQLPCRCQFCGCWNLRNFISSRIYKDDVVLLDSKARTVSVSLPEEFGCEILRLRSVLRFLDGTTIHGMDVIGRYGTIGYIFPSTPKDYCHEIRDEVHNLLFKVERKVLAFKPAEYEVCKVSRIEVTYWVATLRTPKQGTVVVQMLSSGLPLTHKALIVAFSLYLVTFAC